MKINDLETKLMWREGLQFWAECCPSLLWEFQSIVKSGGGNLKREMSRYQTRVPIVLMDPNHRNEDREKKTRWVYKKTWMGVHRGRVQGLGTL